MKQLFLAFALWPIAAQAQQNTTPEPPSTSTETSTETSAEAPAETSASTSDDEIVVVVTPTKNPRRLSETTTAITVISREQIEARKAFDVTDILRQVPSLNLVQSGSRGKIANVFLRGASPSQTLVLIDGLRVNSPSFGAFDFGTLPIDNIERIEVLRGPQSGLYGADAIGGVINIITRRGVGPLRTGGRLEIGNDGTNRQTFSARGETGQNRIAFAATRLNSNGIRQNDDYRNLAASLRFDRAIGTKSNLAFITRFEDAKLGVPGQIFGLDPNERADPRSLFGSLQFTRDGAKRRDKISLGLFDKDLRDEDPTNTGDTFFGSSRIRDKVQTLEAQSAFLLGKHTLTAGAELRRQRARISGESNFGPNNYEGKTSTRAAFIQDELQTGKTSLALSGRYEDNSQFGNDLNGRFSVARKVAANSRIKAAVGTGFQAPTVDQLYSPFGGNVNLQPVENTTFEIGLEQDLPRGGRAELNLYRSRFRNLVGFDANFTAINVDRARAEGLEVSLNQPFGKGFRLVANGGLLSINSTQQRNILRRPKYTAAADLIYRKGKAEFDLGVISRGRSYDVGQTGAAIFGGYSRFDLAASYGVRDNVRVYARLNNIFDREFQEIVGYPTPGRQFVVGVQTGIF